MLQNLPVDLQKYIKNELKPHERVKWVTQPIAKRLFIRSLPIFLFAIPWTAFSVFWVAMAASPWFAEDTPDGAIKWMVIVMPLFGSMFVLVGFGMLAAPFYTWYVAKKAAYVVTDTRAMVVRSGFREMYVQTFKPEQIKDRLKRIRRNGSGDIIFKINAYRDSDGDLQTRHTGFDAVPDVKAAENAIEALIEQSKAEGLVNSGLSDG